MLEQNRAADHIVRGIRDLTEAVDRLTIAVAGHGTGRLPIVSDLSRTLAVIERERLRYEDGDYDRLTPSAPRAHEVEPATVSPASRA